MCLSQFNKLFLFCTMEDWHKWIGDVWGETDPANKIDAIGIGDYLGMLLNLPQPLTLLFYYSIKVQCLNQGEVDRLLLQQILTTHGKCIHFLKPKNFGRKSK